MKLVRDSCPRPKDPLDVEGWIEEMEKTFGALSVLEGKKVDYTAYLLRDTAADWWVGT